VSEDGTPPVVCNHPRWTTHHTPSFTAWLCTLEPEEQFCSKGCGQELFKDLPKWECICRPSGGDLYDPFDDDDDDSYREGQRDADDFDYDVGGSGFWES
jgi:hypothetical protein